MSLSKSSAQFSKDMLETPTPLIFPEDEAAEDLRGRRVSASALAQSET